MSQGATLKALMNEGCELVRNALPRCACGGEAQHVIWNGGFSLVCKRCKRQASATTPEKAAEHWRLINQ